MSENIKYTYPELKKFCNDAFCAVGFTERESEIITDVLLLSDLYGIESHGMQRIVRYHKGIEKGIIKKMQSGTCHAFAAINPEIFGKREDIEAHLSNLLKELRTSPKADGVDKIYTHGEKEILAFDDRLKNGININANTVLEMIDFCSFTGLEPEKYLGKINALQRSYKSSY